MLPSPCICVCLCVCVCVSNPPREHLYQTYSSLRQRHYHHSVCAREEEEEACEVLVTNVKWWHCNTAVSWNEMKGCSCSCCIAAAVMSWNIQSKCVFFLFVCLYFNRMSIVNIVAREILDSRGNPTVEVDLHTGKGLEMNPYKCILFVSLVASQTWTSPSTYSSPVLQSQVCSGLLSPAVHQLASMRLWSSVMETRLATRAKVDTFEEMCFLLGEGGG